MRTWMQCFLTTMLLFGLSTGVAFSQSAIFLSVAQIVTVGGKQQGFEIEADTMENCRTYRELMQQKLHDDMERGKIKTFELTPCAQKTLI